MQRKKVWRYYCDFCGRGMCSKIAMRNHEFGCTMNPDRVCSVCSKVGKVQTTPSIIRNALNDGGIDAAEEAANFCPVCVFSALRFEGVLRDYPYFELKRRLDSFLDEWRDQEQEGLVW